MIISANVERISSDLINATNQLDLSSAAFSDVRGNAVRISQNLSAYASDLREYQRFVNTAHDAYVKLDSWGIETKDPSFYAGTAMLSSGFGFANLAKDADFFAGIVGSASTGILASVFGISTKQAKELSFAKVNGVLRTANTKAMGSQVINKNVASLIRAQHTAKAVGGVLSVVGVSTAIITGALAPANSAGQRVLNAGVSGGMHVTAKSATKGIAKVGGKAVGALSKTKAGAKVGAVVGKFIPIPIVGSIVGAVAGAAIGFGVAHATNWLVNGGLQSVGNAVASGARAVGNAAQSVGNAVVSGARAVGNAISSLFRRRR